MASKSLVALGGAAVLVIAAVVVLARLIVPDEPTFTEGFEEATESPEGSLDFMPTAIGGELEVRGAREGTITMDRSPFQPSFGLGDSKTSIFFEGDPPRVTQMSYDGLAFFPEPEDCEFTEGRHNESLGIVAARLSCPELVDIRGNGTISVEGYVVVPAEILLDLDLDLNVDVPEVGGTITVGDEEWEIDQALLIVDPSVLEEQGVYQLILDTADFERTLYLTYDIDSESLTVAQVHYFSDVSEIPHDRCSTETKEITAVTPERSFWQLMLTCEPVQVSPLGEVTIEGEVVYERKSHQFSVEP